MNTTLVIHHSADLDGLCSREVARRSLGDTADYLGWDYGQPVPDLSTYGVVYLIDISLPREVMAEHAAKLIWIDHHKSAIEAMKDLTIDGYRIDGVAACRLAWQYFHTANYARNKMLDPCMTLPEKQAFLDRKVVEPYAVQLLGEYDIWDKRNPDTDPFQLGMQGEKEPLWSTLFDDAGKHYDDQGRPTRARFARNLIERIVDRGHAIQAYLDTVNAKIITERGFDVKWEGFLFRALNIARSNSLVFQAAIKPEHDGCLSYFWDGGKWRFSLYGVEHKKDLDLSVIASKHGGGGHKQACGGSFTVLPVELGGPHS